MSVFFSENGKNSLAAGGYAPTPLRLRRLGVPPPLLPNPGSTTDTEYCLGVLFLC